MDGGGIPVQHHSVLELDLIPAGFVEVFIEVCDLFNELVGYLVKETT
jgi:hypothetical protein